uniref:Uncharacterized protein n=1 Tax=Arundo donax TaxID=35708 RepID=A0A0A9FW15_ARUDO
MAKVDVTKDEKAAGVNWDGEARDEAALVDVGAVGAVQVGHHQTPVLLLQPSMRARNIPCMDASHQFHNASELDLL